MSLRPSPIFVLLALLTLGACSSSPSSPESAPAPVLEVGAISIAGQPDGAEFVSAAFRDSLEIILGRSFGVQLATPATHTLRGSVQRGEEELFAELELIDSNGETLWTERVDATGTVLSTLAARVSRRVAERLGARGPGGYEYIENVVGGPEMAVSSTLTDALAASRRGDIAAFAEATRGLVEEFPTDPAAHALRAWASLRAWDREPTSERLAILRERLDELNQVDPRSPYDEMMLGYVYRTSGELDNARVLYARVLERNDLTPAARSWALRQSTYTYAQAGDHEGAREAAERATPLDPSNAANRIAKSRALESLGQLDGAIQAATEALALEPFAWRHLQRLGLALFRADRTDEGAEVMERACLLGEAQEVCANTAVILFRNGRRDESIETGRFAEGLTDTAWGHYNLACASALAGDQEKAMGHLRRSFDLGFADVLIESDRDLESLQGRPGFELLLEEVAQRLQNRREQSRAVFPWQG